MHNTLARTLLWFKKAVPLPTRKNFTTQLGCHMEEFGEMLGELRCNAETFQLLADAQAAVTTLAEHIKRNEGAIWVEEENEVEFLDSLCDQIVTAAGVGHMCNYAMLPALDAVNASNFSKFGPDGEPIFDANQKLMKGPNFHRPILAAYI